MLRLLGKIVNALWRNIWRKDERYVSRKMQEGMRYLGANVDGTPMVGGNDIHGRGYGCSRRL